MERISIVRDGKKLNGNEQEQQSRPVQIEKLVYGGEGLGRVDGQVVLVPFVLPQEEVAVATKRVKNGLLRAVSTEVLQPSPLRVPPRCEYFGKCGGCHYQHAAQETQVDAKRAILLETLGRLGGLTFAGEVEIVSGEPWQYRNRIQLHFANGALGFHRAGSNQVYPIEHCPISSPKLNETIAALTKAVKKREWPRFLQSLEVFTNEKDVQLTVVEANRPVAVRFFEWCAGLIPGFADAEIEYAAAGHLFRIGRGSFFQVNRLLIDALVEAVLGDARGETALDLYAGVGLFTLPLAARFAQVRAVERGGSAYRDLEWNTREQAARVETTKGNAEDFLRSEEQAPDLIVADPPRAGLGPELTAGLLRVKAPEVVLVSCDPATLARDLKVLANDYDVTKLTLVDLFPQTYHFETVARLRRR